MANNITIKDGLSNAVDIRTSNVGGVHYWHTGAHAYVANAAVSNSNPVPTFSAPLVAANNFTRPADTTAYASGDLVAANTTNTNVTFLRLDVARGNDLPFKIVKTTLRKSANSTTNATWRVHFYNALPVATTGDNGVYTVSGSNNYVGYVDVATDVGHSDGAAGANATAAITGFPLTGNVLVYAAVEARGAYTPNTGETFWLKVLTTA